MQRIHAVTGETVCLGTQSDLYAQYVHSICSDRPAPYRQKPFTVRPLTRSGLGWLLLSAHSNDRIEHFVRRINYDTLDRSERVRLPDLMERINKVRVDGYVFSRHTVVVGGGMIGILIPDAPDGRRLAMSVHAPVERLEEKQDLIVSELRAAFPAESEAGAAGPLSSSRDRRAPATSQSLPDRAIPLSPGSPTHALILRCQSLSDRPASQDEVSRRLTSIGSYPSRLTAARSWIVSTPGRIRDWNACTTILITF